MTSKSHSRRPTFGILAVVSGVMLASCQTSADEVLSLGEATPAEEASGKSVGKKAFRDPYVSAVSGQIADASASRPSRNETDPARLKRKPMPMAAAYSDIAEPPPEVLALQQQAMQGDPRQAAADLGDITMQPTNASPRSNSLFSAGQRQQAAAVQATEPVSAQAAAGEPVPSGSLVPNEMPTLGVNAVSKSLFSPSPEQQRMMQQRALEEQARAEAAVQAPFAEPAAVGGDEPVLRKLSDPRPKRKMLALREPAGSVPDRVQLTPDQLQAMGAVEEADPAEPLSAEELVADAETAKKRKGWLPSFSDLLKGGKKSPPATAEP
ncbi:hypothetical protein D4A92_16705 [Rhizobium rosettiformans]|uniref:DUF3035 domain-containing protein n=1 Tax=Rhizobium rosettiformans TaxID=1368430 RepID=A0ABX7EYM6_9HYPH|nr:hypothetical protein [Rhizobium rosettiformans]QRF52958.1 hypothetical protein D4A92_16705 [Rhizobium rosettiformans]